MPEYNSYKKDPNYKDRFNPDLNWSKLLFQNNTPLQAAELNDLQSLIFHEQKQILNTIFPDGYILEGLIANEIQKFDNLITYKISSGYIYFQGRVLFVNGRDEINIPIETDYQLYVKVEEKIIDNETNSHILPDSIIGHKGSKRLERIGYLTLDIGDIDLYYSRLGYLYKSHNLKLNINSQISNFIFDRFGNFLVKGYSVSYINNQLILNNSSNSINSSLTQNIININNKRADLNTKIADIEKVIIDLKDSNPLLLQELNNRKDILKNELSSLDSELNEINLELSDFYLINSQEKSSYLDYNFQISPGVAYVLGNRLEQNFIRDLKIKTIYKEELVEGAIFNYLNDFGLFINSLVSIDKTNFQINVSLSLEDIFYIEQSYDIDISLTILISSNTQSNLDILRAFVSQINSLQNISELTLTSISHPSANKLLLAEIIYEALNFTTDGVNLFIRNKTEDTINISIEGDIEFSSSNFILDRSTPKDIKLAYEVTSIKRVMADRLKEDRLVIKQRDKDYLGEDSIIEIINVYQGDNRYIETIDFRLEDNSYLVWISDKAPKLGTSYFVDFVFTENLNPTTDYLLSNNSIKFIGKKPYTLGKVYVDYNYLPDVKAIIYLDSNNKISYTLGNRSLRPYYPLIPDSALEIAKVLLSKNKVEIFPSQNYIISNLDINNLLIRIREIELRSNILNYDNLIYNFNYSNSNLIDYKKSNFSFNSNTGYMTVNSIHNEYFIDSNINFKRLNSIKTESLNQDILTNNLVLTTTKSSTISFLKNINISNRILRYSKSSSPFDSYSHILEDVKDSDYLIYQNYENLSNEVNREGLTLYSIDNNLFDEYTQENFYYLDITIYNFLPHENSLRFLLDNSQILTIEYLTEGVKLSDYICQASSKGQIKGRVKVSLSKPKVYKLAVIGENDLNIAVGNFILRDSKLDNFVRDLNLSWDLSNNSFINSDYKYLYKSINNEDRIIPPNLIQYFFLASNKDINSLSINTIPLTVDSSSCIVAEIVEYQDKLSYKSLLQVVLVYDNTLNIWTSNFNELKLEKDIQYALLLKVPPTKSLSVGIAKLLDIDFYSGNQIYYFNNLNIGKLYISEDLKSYRELYDSQLSFSLFSSKSLELSNTYQEIFDLSFSKKINHFCLNEIYSLIYPSFNRYLYSTDNNSWNELIPNQVFSIDPTNNLKIQVQLNTYNFETYPYLELDSISLSTYSLNNSYSIFTKEIKVYNSCVLYIEMISVDVNSLQAFIFNPSEKELSKLNVEVLDSELSLYRISYDLSLDLTNPYSLSEVASFVLNIKDSVNQNSKVSLIKNLYILEK